MSLSDALIVGEGWISEHYFTTDTTSESFQARVIERRKQWDDEEKSARTRFIAARPELEVELASLAELSDAGPHSDRQSTKDAAEAVYDGLLDILGLTGHGLVIARSGSLLRVSAPGIADRAPLVVLYATPVDTVEAILAKDGPTLPEPVLLDDDQEPFTSAARLVSALFVDDDYKPELVLVLAGRWAVLAERERWAEGRYLAIDVQLVCERNDTKRGGEIDKTLTCLSVESIAPDADGNLWWLGVLEESVKHTVGVSQDLRDGVRLSIEIIANEVVARRAAQGLEPLPQSQAQPLAKQSLRFLYRILFLLYAEASPELGVLPVNVPEYAEGYSLDRLRELVQVSLATPQAKSGTHLYNSLGVLFRLVDHGHIPSASGEDDEGTTTSTGLTFNALRADLFLPQATALIDQVGLGNEAVQRVLAHLLLSKERRGRDRGFISYAELGINQLGAVYEGLMSYTGFFAGTDLYEVAKGGDGSKGSWVVPVDRAGDIASTDFVRTTDPQTGEERPVVHERGQFVFRLAGRERQQSASYYTPEVLTRFTVRQALEELLDQDGGTTSAAEVLRLTVCEPALGSGAFAIEAVGQLAEEYLDRRQNELEERIDPDEYPSELQKVKSYIALHNVYGVDLNATAVELAEISVWLDTMGKGLAAPWFGLHLRRGNSLIGARRATFRRDQLAKKAWLTAVPTERPLRDPETGIPAETAGGVHHFLLPAAGWGSAVDAKEVGDLAPEALKALKEWRRRILVSPNKEQTAALADIAGRVETLWQFTIERLRVAESHVRRHIDVWHAEDLPADNAVSREQVEEYLADPKSAYRRLRRVMDAWCALWFWPLTSAVTTVDEKTVTPPSLDDWIKVLRGLVGSGGSNVVARGRLRGWEAGDQTLTDTEERSWAALGERERDDLAWANAVDPEKIRESNPWLIVCERVAEQQGFFHWELDLAPVFADRGGFDLQVGNPPWVRPRSDVNGLLAEGDPWWQLKAKSTAAEDAQHRAYALSLPGIADLVVDGTTDVAASAAYLGGVAQYPHLQGLQPDLYRCFMEQTWRHAGSAGSVGLIHPETHFTDEKAGLLRQATYRRLRRHWQFINELVLFEIHDLVRYGVHVYGTPQEPLFVQATSLYHPDTVDRSLKHEGSGAEPGLKDPDGNWDLRPHASRIQYVDRRTLTTWHAVLENDDVPTEQTRMVYTVNRSTAAVLDKLARASRIGSLGLRFSRGWDESIDRKKGRFDSEWGVPESWDDAILQGPHLHVATPFYKTPNPTMLHNQDWTATDFEALAPDAIPATSYKRRGDNYEYDVAYTDWGTDAEPDPARDHYRIAWRRMAANTGERTLIPALIPPGTAHVNGIFSAGMTDRRDDDMLIVAATMASLVTDFSVRSVPKTEILYGTIGRLALADKPSLRKQLLLRVLRLNCVTDAYADLWESCFSRAFHADSWTGGDEHRQRSQLSDIEMKWTSTTPLRVAADRRQALVEIDALVALSLGITADELCTIYRTQFPVLYGYDRNVYYYDANGRIVPNSVLTTWRKRCENAGLYTQDELTARHPGSGVKYRYNLPFATLDREGDLRQAYAEFERRLARRASNAV